MGQWLQAQRRMPRDLAAFASHDAAGTLAGVLAEEFSQEWAPETPDT